MPNPTTLAAVSIGIKKAQFITHVVLGFPFPSCPAKEKNLIFVKGHFNRIEVTRHDPSSWMQIVNQLAPHLGSFHNIIRSIKVNDPKGMIVNGKKKKNNSMHGVRTMRNNRRMKVRL